MQSANSPNVFAWRRDLVPNCNGNGWGPRRIQFVGRPARRTVIGQSGFWPSYVLPRKGHLWWASAHRLFTHRLTGEQYLQFANKPSNQETNVGVNVTPGRQSCMHSSRGVVAGTRSEQITSLLFALRQFPWKRRINRRHHRSSMFTWLCQPFSALMGGTDHPGPCSNSPETGKTES